MSIANHLSISQYNCSGTAGCGECSTVTCDDSVGLHVVKADDISDETSYNINHV